MKKIIIILSLISICGILEILNASSSGGGAAPYLRMGVGARARGLGKAFTAIADDATANYYNPAGLVQMQKKEFAFMLSNLSLDRKLSYASCVIPYQNHYFGISWLGFGVDDIEERGMNGTLDGSFDFGNSAYQFSYGNRIIEKLSIGASIKYLDSKFKGLTYTNKGKADGWGLDFGLMYFANENLRIAFAVQDMYSKLDWKTGTKETVPNLIKFGSSYLAAKNKLLFSAELERESYGEEISFNAGAEWWIVKLFAIRLGTRDGHFSGGLSFKSDIGNIGLEFDYAYLEDTFSEEYDENAGHQFSMNVKF